MADVARLGIEIDSRGVPRADGQLKKLTKTSGGTEKATNKLAGSWRSFSSLILTGGVALAFRSIIRHTVEAEHSIAGLRAGLASTGGISGQTMGSLTALADEMQRTTIYGDELVESAERILLTFTQVRGEAFAGTVRAAADLSTAMGTDLKSAMIQLGKAMNAPVQNLSALSRSGIQFTKEQKDLIKVLWETGRQAEAQTLILKELENQFGGSAKAARETLGGALWTLSNAWGDFQEKIGEGIGPALTVVLETLSSFFGNIDRWINVASVAWIGSWEEVKTTTLMVWAALKGGLDVTAGAMEDTWNKVIGTIQALISEFLLQAGKSMVKVENAIFKASGRIVNLSAGILTASDNMHAAASLNITDTNNQATATEEFKDKLMTLATEHNETMDALNKSQGEYLFNIDNTTTAHERSGDAAKEAADKAKEAADKTKAATKKLSENQKLAASGVRSFSDAIVEWASGAEVSFASVAEDFAKMVAKMLLQQALLSAFGLTPTAPAAPTALGAAFSGGRRLAFARGGIVTQPTLFPMARGAGLMGEAGPEAVMPLARTSKGELGVNVEGSAPIVNVSIINNTGAKVTERREQRGDSLDIDVMIGDSIANHLNRGTADRAMRDSFGVRRRSAGR